MPQDLKPLPPGAGATNPSSTPGASVSAPIETRTESRFTPVEQSIPRPVVDTGAFHHEPTDYRQPSREVVVTAQAPERPRTAVVVGAALAGALAGGAIPFMLARRSSSGQRRREDTVVQESVTINRPAAELYGFWRNFTNLPQFMDNIKSVDELDSRRSHWVIKAPAGTSVEFNSRVVEDVPGKVIAWESEEGASVPNRGRVEFHQGPTAGTTLVRTTISYDPPAGVAGRAVAKLFQREPAVQARQDLARFKELMESGRGR